MIVNTNTLSYKRLTKAGFSNFSARFLGLQTIYGVNNRRYSGNIWLISAFYKDGKEVVSYLFKKPKYNFKQQIDAAKYLMKFAKEEGLLNVL